MEHRSRYWIGIDLGTTNSVVAYIDSKADDADRSDEIRVLQVPQLVAANEVRAFPALPSFLYFPLEHETAADGVTLPWEENSTTIAGVLAREQGALVAGRQVSSAKSWLCQSAVDRRGKILPWEAEPQEPKVSPVEASACYLAHLRQAWNYSIGAGEDTRFENQQIVLTVPASFDEEARELTVDAAKQAGLKDFTLLEEPMAAFYAWIANHRELIKGGLRGEELRSGDLVLICDIGGGTTDFSLIRARVDAGEVQFERTAIGEHLLLGGDNLDIALARRVEERLSAGKLNIRQRHALQRACCAAKERLLGDSALERVAVHVLGSGRAVVGQMLAGELSREDVSEVLIGGFLPLTNATEFPRQEGRVGLRELGLPYASDPAITKHLAAFLSRASESMKESASSDGAPRVARPDAILFNGGFCAAEIARERIVEAISGWFRRADSDWRPKVLDSGAMESAVAAGAAYYARVRQGAGVRIKAGSACSYYVATRVEHGIQGVCVLPKGTEEGTTLPLPNREFTVLANRPVSFRLYSSTTRRDAHGELVALSEEQVHRHAPLGTLLRYGKKMREIQLAVRLRATFTEMGTLELWCESLASAHRWRLQFELRGDEGQAPRESAGAERAAASRKERPSEEQDLREAIGLIHGVFGREASAESQAGAPEKLVGKLEEVLGAGKDSWTIDTIRKFCEALCQSADGRKKSVQHEVRWFNLFGFCLRPGFGTRDDDSMMRKVRQIYLAGPAFPREIPSQAELLVLLRRVSGGLNASQQHELYRSHAAALGIVGGRRKERINSQVERESWRLLASLEHLSAMTRAQLGNELLSRIKKDSNYRGLLWSLARLGSRIPLYGPLNCVVALETAAEWIKALLALKELTPESAFAIVQLGACTGDRARDIDETLRRDALARLAHAEMAGESRERLEHYVIPTRAEIERIFGESLPRGLHLVTSANCLLSVTALTADFPADTE